MERKVYEYIVVNTDWFGNLDKGIRLYYDYSRNGYIYHYETEDTTKNSKYHRTSFESIDYFISLDIADNQIKTNNMICGPELGAIETKCENCKCK